MAPGVVGPPHALASWVAEEITRRRNKTATIRPTADHGLGPTSQTRRSRRPGSRSRQPHPTQQEQDLAIKRPTDLGAAAGGSPTRSEEQTSELQSPYAISYAVFC